MEGQMGHQALLKEPSDQRPWSNACWQNTARVWGHLTLAQRSNGLCAIGTIHWGFGLQGIGPSCGGCIRPLALGLMELRELLERNWAHWAGPVGSIGPYTTMNRIVMGGLCPGGRVAERRRMGCGLVKWARFPSSSSLFTPHLIFIT